jgi:hypothetical protein
MARKPIPVEPYIDKIEQALLLGASYAIAARYAGISISTFERWRAQAEHARPGTPLARLRERLSAAEGRAAIGWLAHIEQAARDGDWRASAWKLERRFPDQYGRRVQADVSVRIREMAQEVAEEIGIDVDLLMNEVHGYLREHPA